MPLTIPQTQQILLSYFQTGRTPTQDQFAEFISTMFYLYQDMLNQASTANAAAASAVAAVAASGAKAYANIVFSIPSTVHVATQGTALNIASLAVSGVNLNVTINFTTALPNAFYKVLASVPFTIVSQTVNTLVISSPNFTNQFAANGGSFSLVIFP